MRIHMFFLSSGVWTGNNAFFIIAAVVAVVAAAVVAGVFILSLIHI